MPRREAVITPKAPLSLISAIVKKEVKKAGEELVRIVVKKVGRHYYNVSVRTRSISRELSVSFSFGRPSRLKKPPGMRPAA